MQRASTGEQDGVGTARRADAFCRLFSSWFLSYFREVSEEPDASIFKAENNFYIRNKLSFVADPSRGSVVYMKITLMEYEAVLIGNLSVSLEFSTYIFRVNSRIVLHRFNGSSVLRLP